MKTAIFLLMIFMLSGKYCVANDATSPKRDREVKFDQKALLSCETQNDIELCLYKSLGKEIGFNVKEGRLMSVNFPKLRGGTFIVNGTTFKKAFNPSIKFFRKPISYSVCGTQEPIVVGRYMIKGMGSCICGFNENGNFSLEIGERYSFAPKNIKILANSVACDSEMKNFDAGSIAILEKAKICGYDFPKDTEFYILESYPAFKAPKIWTILGKGGETIVVKKGKEYMSNSSLEKPCNWEPVIEYDESGLPITD